MDRDVAHECIVLPHHSGLQTSWLLEEALHVHLHQLHRLDQWAVLHHGVDGDCGRLVHVPSSGSYIMVTIMVSTYSITPHHDVGGVTVLG